MSNTITLPPHLSYSALSSYSECGERFRLSRGHHLDQATWYATLAGSAVHEITEAYDMARDFGVGPGASPEDFAPNFLSRIEREVERGVEVKASGRKLKEIGKTGGPGKKNADWWLQFGPEYVQRWIDWRDATPDWRIAVMPDGQPGVEVAVTAPIGGVPHKGFIDRMFIVGGEDLVVVDLKMGNVPPSRLQLGSYRTAVKNQYGLDARWGGYWMGSDGEFAGGLIDLSVYDPEYIEAQYAMARRGIEAGVFLPNVTSMCSACPVRDYCRAVGGSKVHEVPIIDVVQVTTPQA